MKASRARAIGVAVVVAAAVAAAAVTARGPADLPSDHLAGIAVQPAVPPFDREELTDARDERIPDSPRPAIAAAFDSESYRPGKVARLVFFDTADHVSLRLFRVGDAVGDMQPRDVMRGVAVGSRLEIGHVGPGRTVRVRLGEWQSALYWSGARVGYAPFVLAPARLGESRIGLVLPTQTWEAYNYRDDNHDGVGDTWYAGEGQTTARLYRPFENRGVPPHYKYYDEPILRWLVRKHYRVDVLSDKELKETTGKRLARAYDVLVFSGHHEYVTEHEYDAVVAYRDLGGSLLFLSADNFYSKIEIRGAVMTRVGWWRFLGRPESALVGVQFYRNDDGTRRGPWRIRSTPPGRWVFTGTGLGPGDDFSSGGIEADEVSTASPPGTWVLAQIPNLYGDGRSAQMTLYETPRGGIVFAAGAFTLACSVWQPPVGRVVENLLARATRR